MSIENQTFSTLFEKAPFLIDFFHAHNMPEPKPTLTPGEYFESLSEQILEDQATSKEDLLSNFIIFTDQLLDFTIDDNAISELEIIGGRDKNGELEKLRIKLHPGDVLSIVGPTGAGKSRFLEDIECLAQGDTPTGRNILLNGCPPDDSQRFNIDNHLVAQLSQNMNFVVDLCVADFLLMHAESRMIENPHHVVNHIFRIANELAGEKFSRETSVTSLSGGQSRALMIADTACLSRSPIVLIDEIENAGVDRYKALELLIKEEKIVLLVTHDPELALFAPRRLIIKNGGMQKLILRDKKEEQSLNDLRQLSQQISQLRNNMRSGKRVSFSL